MLSASKKLAKHLGETIRAERRMRKMTQEALAFEAELNLTFISEIELGKTTISVETVTKLARGLGMKAWELLAKADL